MSFNSRSLQIALSAPKPQLPAGRDGGLRVALSAVCTVTSIALATGLFANAVLIAAALLGASVLPIYSLCVAYTNDHLVPAQIVPASGSLVLSLNIGIFVGAFVGPASLGIFGAIGMPIFLGAVGALTATVAVVRVLRSTVPEDTGVAQPIAAQGAQTVGVLHPDAALLPGHKYTK